MTDRVVASSTRDGYAHAERGSSPMKNVPPCTCRVTGADSVPGTSLTA